MSTEKTNLSSYTLFLHLFLHEEHGRVAALLPGQATVLENFWKVFLGFLEIERPWCKASPLFLMNRAKKQRFQTCYKSPKRGKPLPLGRGVPVRARYRSLGPRSSSPVLFLVGRRCTLTSATAAMRVLFPSRLLTRSMILSVMSLIGFSSSPISSADCRRRHTIKTEHHIRCAGEPAIYKPSQAAKALATFNR